MQNLKFRLKESLNNNNEQNGISSIQYNIKHLKMKHLILVRHAKSDWSNQVSDFERPIKRRSYDDIKLVADRLLNHDFNIDIVCSSDAKRAKQTVEAFVEHLNIDTSQIVFKHDMYDFSGFGLLSVVTALDESVTTALCFGHNHAITDFVNKFGNQYIDNVPTAGLVWLTFNVDSWSDIESGETRLILFPKLIKNSSN